MPEIPATPPLPAQQEELPTRVIRAYGTWASPISARRAAAGARRFGMLQANDHWVVWTEGRPEDGGRQMIVAAEVGSDGRLGPALDRLPAPYSARSRVHEYGGGEILLDDAHVYFVNARDQGIYRVALHPNGAVEPVCVVKNWRFADMAVLPGATPRLVAVAEVHSDDDDGHPSNCIVRIALDEAPDRPPGIICQTHDFYASPRPSPDGTLLAFLAWNLPDMPWDAAALRLMSLDFTDLDAITLAGGREQGVALYGPHWSADGTLYAISDASGWGQVMAWPDAATAQARVGGPDAGAGASLTAIVDDVSAAQKASWRNEPRVRAGDGRFVLPPRSVEFGKPLWNLGTRTLSSAGMVSTPGKLPILVASGQASGSPVLTSIDDAGATDWQLPESFVRVDEPVATAHGVVAYVAEAARPASIVRLVRSDDGIVSVERLGAEPQQPDADEHRWFSVGTPEMFRRVDGVSVPAIVYPPTSPTHEGLAGSQPPTLIFVHGGPTSAASRALSLRVQYFTSRGFQVVDVDYAGSVGYGRAHRARLDGMWGIADVEDCAAVARCLVEAGRADGARLAIAGGSAGGYTVLMALATTDIFAAGSCHYGISDLALLDAHTHKFESGYQRRLIGGGSEDAYQARLKARSPLTLVDQIAAPVIFFQGLDDKVVPPEQTRLMMASLKKRGIDARAHEFVGEGHGFRRAETIETVLEAELAFFRSVLRLDPDA